LKIGDGAAPFVNLQFAFFNFRNTSAI